MWPNGGRFSQCCQRHQGELRGEGESLHSRHDHQGRQILVDFYRAKLDKRF